MTNPAQSGRPTYLPIHYGRIITANSPGKVLCTSNEASTPVTDDWRYVTCLRCLEIGTERGAPTARRMLEVRRLEAEEDGD